MCIRDRDISIGQGVTYNGLYAGFHLLDSEREGALEWLEKGGYGFVTENYYGSSNKPAVTVSVGASPVEEPGVSDWLDGNDMIHNGFDASKEYSVYMTLNLPKVTAENAAIKVADGEVAKGTAGEMYILPVSYTHLDVYKRQQLHHLPGGDPGRRGLKQGQAPSHPGQQCDRWCGSQDPGCI